MKKSEAKSLLIQHNATVFQRDYVNLDVLITITKETFDRLDALDLLKPPARTENRISPHAWDPEDDMPQPLDLLECRAELNQWAFRLYIYNKDEAACIRYGHEARILAAWLLKAAAWMEKGEGRRNEKE